MITLDNVTAHLTNGSMSYVLTVDEQGNLLHRYAGRALRAWGGALGTPYAKRGYNTAHSMGNVSFDDYPFAYPVRGRGDFRAPAFAARRADGAPVMGLVFQGWRVLGEKPALPGLPATRAAAGEADTLEVTLADEPSGIRVVLLYTIFSHVNAVAVSARVENAGDAPVTLERVLSASVELPAEPYDMLMLYGSHTREGQRERFRVHHGLQGAESARGASSPQHQPFFALMDPSAGELAGQVRGFALVYSGNFAAQVECDQFGSVRAQLGINPEGFSWRLEPGEAFQAPEALMVWSAEGLNGMSAAFHQVVRRHLMPARYADLERPVLLNSWEAMYCDVSMGKIERQARAARDAGMELFVLDDGWFRPGNDTHSATGDWECNLSKLPGGIEGVAELVHGAGLKFGLWFEPEAVGAVSRLAEEHPDWVLRVPGYDPVVARHEYLLDLGRADVRDHLVAALDRYLDGGLVDYVKWDMNRPLTDVFSAALLPERAGEAAHRYVLGLYEVLRRVFEAHPGVLLETCSSGGARLDLGMLAYAGQNWASDNTDAYDRVDIQAGLSLVYPPVALGAHVSAVPNHQTGRATALDTRYQVARAFNLGYELDLTQCDADDLAAIAAQVAEHKAERAWAQGARFLRLEAPDGNHAAWELVAADGARVLVEVMQRRCDLLHMHGRVRLAGLDDGAAYRVAAVTGLPDDMAAQANAGAPAGGPTAANACAFPMPGSVVGGDELMYVGVAFPQVTGDAHMFSLALERAAE